MSSAKLFPSFGDVLKSYRSKTDFTQQDIAKEMGVTKTTYFNWENDISSPNLKQIRYLCRKFSIPVHELMGVPERNQISPAQSELLSIYDALSPNGKILLRKIGQNILETESDQYIKRICSDAQIIGGSERRMAAGEGSDINNEPLFTDVLFVHATERSRNADVIMHVSGPSMEPTYHDGDMVYVRLIDYIPSAGSVVYATVGNQAVIKRVGSDRQLHSDNERFPFSDKFEDDNVRIHGLVLGTVLPSDFYSGDDLSALSEARAEEIDAFRKTHNIFS